MNQRIYTFGLGIHELVLILIIVLASYLPSFTLCQEKSSESSKDEYDIKFDDRLRYYLNEQTQSVIEELLAREIQLSQLIYHINDEVELRGLKGVKDDQPGFREIYGPMDKLIDEYNRELDQLVSIYDDIKRLQKVAEYGDNFSEWENLTSIKNDIVKSVEDRSLYKQGIYTLQRVGAMVEEYTFELDSLLNMYDQLDYLRTIALASSNSQLLDEVTHQQENLKKVLSKWNDLGPYNEFDFLRLNLEFNAIHRVVRKIDSLQTNRSEIDSKALLELKESLLNRVDHTMYDLLVNAGFSVPSRPKVTEFVDTWKKERLIDIKTRLKEYQIIHYNLIETGNRQQRDRMLARDMSNALLNYADGKFRTTEYQITAIMDNYNNYYSNFTPFLYYLAECRYHRGAYDSARETYEQVIGDTAQSTFRVEAYVRLMQYARDFALENEFFSNYEKVLENKALASGEIVPYAHYLVANRFFKNRRYDRTEQVLKEIPEECEFFKPAQLLLGIVYANQNNFDKAIEVFENLSKMTNYPWTDLNSAYIRNSALVRLGLIYYQKGEFQKAIEKFDLVSQGFENHDLALIGQAWANLRMRNIDGAMERSHNLLRNYLASNFTYEALVLSAHCKQLLDQPETALNAYRYVVRAHGASEVREELNKERSQLLAQTRELNRIEAEALERRQKDIYPKIDAIRANLNNYLMRLSQRSDSGSQLIQDYHDERLDIFDTLYELDAIIRWAEKEKRQDLVKKVQNLRIRLVKVLETYRAEKDVVNTAFLVDFPLAAKEANTASKRDNLSTLFQDLNIEKGRLERSLELVDRYKNIAESTDYVSERNDLEILESDLNILRDKLSRFRKWVAGGSPGVPESNVDYWSDISGFGMSNIIYQERKSRLEKIDDYANKLKAIETLLSERRLAIEQKLEQFENEMRQLQDNLLNRKIQLEQLERKIYFEKYYFDSKEEEEESWEDRLKRLNNP